MSKRNLTELCVRQKQRFRSFHEVTRRSGLPVPTAIT